MLNALESGRNVTSAAASAHDLLCTLNDLLHGSTDLEAILVNTFHMLATLNTTY